MNRSVKHVDFLDHFRGIAIIAVLLLHTLNTVYGDSALRWNGWFRNFDVPVSFLCFLPCSFGQAGVAIFFVVSGFCIHMSFQQQGQRWGGFFIRRFFRLYPAYLAALIFCLWHTTAYTPWLTIRTSPGFWPQLLTHLFLVQNCSPATNIGINGAYWTLAVEAQLYLLYPVLLMLAARLGWRRTMVVLAGGEILLRGLEGLIGTVGAVNTLGGDISGLLNRSPLGFWFSWSLGAYIADAYLKKQPLPFLKNSAIRWFALAIFCYFVKPLDSFRFLLFAVVTAVVASQFLSGAGPKIKVPAFSLAMLRNVGLWSYSIYLLHLPLLQMYYLELVWFVPAKYRSSPIEFLLISVTWLAVILFGWLWYKLFELPSIALGKRIIKRIDMCRGASVPEITVGNGQAGMITEVNTKRVTKSKYCLMIAALLAIAVGNILIATKLNPPAPAACNDLAWSLATNPEATHRNGPLAVRLAECACGQTHYSNAIMVGTLAAAYAEAGRFDEAVSTAQLACIVASQKGQQELWQKNIDLMGLYLDHQPYHEAAAPPSDSLNR